MFKSSNNADQDDFFDFLRIDNAQLADHDWVQKRPSEVTGLDPDPLLHPFTETGPGKDKRTDTFS